VVTEQTLADLFPDAVAAYRRSVADVDYVRGLWVDAGRPLVADHGNGSAGIHPLLRAVQESEVLANRLRGVRVVAAVGEVGDQAWAWASDWCCECS
jgi:hypothetical protein